MSVGVCVCVLNGKCKNSNQFLNEKNGAKKKHSKIILLKKIQDKINDMN